MELLGCAGDVEVDACFVIYLLCCGEIKLVNRNIATMLIADVESGSGQGVVVNLLRWTTVFEDERDGILVFGGGCGRCWCRLRLCRRLLRRNRLLIGRWRALVGSLLSIAFNGIARVVGLAC